MDFIFAQVVSMYPLSALHKAVHTTVSLKKSDFSTINLIFDTAIFHHESTHLVSIGFAWANRLTYRYVVKPKED